MALWVYFVYVKKMFLCMFSTALTNVACLANVFPFLGEVFRHRSG